MISGRRCLRYDARMPHPSWNDRSDDGISEPSSHEGSNGDTGLTSDLSGASMRTVSMRVVIVPPRFEGLPTASSQTVPMDGCFSTILSLREMGTTTSERTRARAAPRAG